MAALRVIAVIPTYNGIERLKKCLSALRALEPGDYSLKVFVVNDASTDGTAEILKKEFPEVRVLEGNGSLWWTGAIQLGSNAAYVEGCDYVLWLNDDDEIAKDALCRLVDCAKQFPGAIVASGVVYSDSPHRVHIGNQLKLVDLKPPQPRYVSKESFQGMRQPVEFDLFGGHGVLIPSPLVSACSNLIRPRALPHYYGDYAFYLGARHYNIRKIIAPLTIVYNNSNRNEFQNGDHFHDLRRVGEYLFSRRSAGNLRDRPILALFFYPMPFNVFWAILFAIRSIGAVTRAIYWCLFGTPERTL